MLNFNASPFNFVGPTAICSFEITEWDDVTPKNCVLCNEKVENPSVTLFCSCEYHLKCFKLIEKNNKCIKCKDCIKKEKEHDFQQCSICLELVKKEPIKLPCNHQFHRDCINQWYHTFNQQNRNKCPICRTPY